MTAIQDITGQRFGLLTVEKFSRSSNGSYWTCKCDCGGTTEVIKSSLKKGITRSCGCLRITRMSGEKHLNYKHGKSHSREFAAWRAIKVRCFNSKCAAFHNYGGRGITMCDRWLDSFENFLADMGPKPSPKHTIDRINNSGNYEPSNCCWRTYVEQMRNRRTLKVNSSGQTGVHFCKVTKKWKTLIGLNNKQILLGYFANIEDAIAARKAAEIKYWGNR